MQGSQHPVGEERRQGNCLCCPKNLYCGDGRCVLFLSAWTSRGETFRPARVRRGSYGEAGPVNFENDLTIPDASAYNMGS